MPHHNKKADKLATPDPPQGVSPDAEPKEILERGSQDVESAREERGARQEDGRQVEPVAG